MTRRGTVGRPPPSVQLFNPNAPRIWKGRSPRSEEWFRTQTRASPRVRVEAVLGSDAPLPLG